MPTTTDYGMSYLGSFYNAGMPLKNEETVGASYKGFNDSLASWGANRVMGQQCGQTWLQTFSKLNGLYNSGKQLPALQLVTWNDYEEGTEIESGINNCFSVSASASGNSLHWTIKGSESTVDHYVAYISTDGQNLMSLGNSNPGTSSLNLCSYALSNGKYTAYVQAVGKPSITNQMSGAVKVTLNCSGTKVSDVTLSIGASPSSMNLTPGRTGNLNVTVAASGGEFNTAIALACAGLPKTLTCSFSPASVIPGANSVSSVLTLTAAPVTASGPPRKGVSLPGCVGFRVRAVRHDSGRKVSAETNRAADRRLYFGWTDHRQLFVRGKQHERRQDRHALVHLYPIPPTAMLSLSTALPARCSFPRMLSSM